MKTNNGITLLEMVVTIVIMSAVVMIAGYLLVFGIKNTTMAPKIADLDSKAQLFLERITRDLSRIYPIAGDGFTATTTSITFVTPDLEQITYEKQWRQIKRTTTTLPEEAILDNVYSFTINLYDSAGNIDLAINGNIRLIQIKLTLASDGIMRDYQTTVFPTSWRLSP